jgi:hypothetical protein
MTVSDQIIQVLDALCEKFGLVIDWTSENALPYLTTLCTKLVSFEIWTSVFWLVILFIGSIVGVMLIKRLCPIFKAGCARSDWSSADWEVGSGFAIIGAAFFYAIVCAGIISNVIDIIKCLTFPEMFIFEYVQGVINAAQ